MSIDQILAELPYLSPQELLQVAEKALALDDLSPVDVALVEQRLAAHDCNPAEASSSDDFLTQLRLRHGL